jgi:steroid Delta-isomerase
MSFEPDVLKGFVERYLDTVASGDAEAVAALYTEDATLEDPVGGGEVHIGRQAILGFYKALNGQGDIATELLNFRAGGHDAAFVFAITVAGAVRVEPIEILSFDGDGRITSMRAYWSPGDIITL